MAGALQGSSHARGVDRARALTLALLPICAALALRAIVIEPFAVRSESMLPTLAPGDHVFVNKLAYGARVPFTSLRLPALREPARGDLVVLEGDGDRRARLVKRIVGLPGERVSLRDGHLLGRGAAREQSDVVPAGHYFVLGDNRAHSADSRAFGPVARERLIGPIADLPGSGPRHERPGVGDE